MNTKGMRLLFARNVAKRGESQKARKSSVL